MRNSPADIKVSEGEGGSASGTGAETPLQSIVEQFVPFSSWMITVEQIPNTVAHGGIHT